MLEGAHARRYRLLGLVAHVDAARRIVTDQHDGETRNEALLAREPRPFGSHPFDQLARDPLAVDHQRAGHD